MNESEPKDLRLELRVKNNRLYSLIHDRYTSVAQFCRAHGFKQSSVGRYLNFKQNPVAVDWSKVGYCAVCGGFLASGPKQVTCEPHFNMRQEVCANPSGFDCPWKWRKDAIGIAAAFKKLPEDIWPEILRGVRNNKASIEVSVDEAAQLVGSSSLGLLCPPDEKFEDRSELRARMKNLGGRELRAIVMYFEEGATTVEIGKEFGVSTPRATQILYKALRTLRRPVYGELDMPEWLKGREIIKHEKISPGDPRHLFCGDCDTVTAHKKANNELNFRRQVTEFMYRCSICSAERGFGNKAWSG